MSQPPPHFQEISNAIPPHVAVERLAQLPHVLLLDSSMHHQELGRYSFLMADPAEWFTSSTESAHATFDWLDQQVSHQTMDTIRGLPPFQGGVAGLFTYEFNSAIEAIPGGDRLNLPLVALGVYDTVVAWDHKQNRAWLVSTGFPNHDEAARQTRAITRAEQFLRLLEQPVSGRLVRSGSAPGELTVTPTGFSCPDYSWLKSNFSSKSYRKTIRRVLEYIRAGDVFQVNIAQQLVCPAFADSLDLYQRLRHCNSSTFAAYFDVGDSQVISASPERLVSVRDGCVETRPIKGTRRRTRHPEVDIDVGQQLLASQKDRAENVMIVDLMRNDLSRICTDDSVRVSQFVELESYASVLHLVSAVQGQMRHHVSPGELLKAVFPGGSVTGAPKVRAMEIIAELEPNPRGPYCGSLGYFGFDGSVDLNILIRTITANRRQWAIPVGGGIVADSDPDREYEETWTKAHGMLQAVSEFVPGESQPVP